MRLSFTHHSRIECTNSSNLAPLVIREKRAYKARLPLFMFDCLIIHEPLKESQSKLKTERSELQPIMSDQTILPPCQRQLHSTSPSRQRPAPNQTKKSMQPKTIVVVYTDRSVACKQLHLHDHSAALVSDNTIGKFHNYLDTVGGASLPRLYRLRRFIPQHKYHPIIVSQNMIIIGRVIKIGRNLVNGRQP